MTGREIIPQNAGLPAEKRPLPVLPPAKLNKAAIRADLAREFRKYMDERPADRTAAQAAEDFVIMYNSGMLYPSLFKTLGKVSKATLYRWNKVLRDTGDCASLADNRGGHNKGESIVSEVEGQTLLKFLLDPRRLTVGQAIEYMREILASAGRPAESSEKTLRRYVERFQARHYDVWVLAREGEKALKDKVSPYLERDDSLLSVGDVLVADGHRCNFQVFHPFSGRPIRPSLVAWQDWASRDICGYAFVLEEDVYAIHMALRAALLRLGRIPRVVYLDNGKGFKARLFTGEAKKVDFEAAGVGGLYGRLGIMTVFAQPYNARAKPIERFFDTLSESFERLLPSFTGRDITDKPAWMKRNEKFIQRLHPETRPLLIQEAYELFETWLNRYYRVTPHDGLDGACPGAVFEAGRGAGLDDAGLRFLMMAQEQRGLSRQGVRLYGRSYWHESLYGLKGRVMVRYDLADLSKVHVCDLDGNHLATAERVEPVHPMARLSDRPDDYTAVKEGIKQQRRLARQTKAVVTELVGSGRGRDIDLLPWNRINEIDPDLIDQVEGIIGGAEAETSPIPVMEPAEVVELPRRGPDPVRYLSQMSDEDLDAEFNRAIGGSI